jgi:hypothetical protein
MGSKKHVRGGFPRKGWGFSSVADPDPGPGAYLMPESGIRYEKKIRSRMPGSGMFIPDLIF